MKPQVSLRFSFNLEVNHMLTFATLAASGRSRRLLEDSGRAGVWPDSVQVSGGKLSMRLPSTRKLIQTTG